MKLFLLSLVTRDATPLQRLLNQRACKSIFSPVPPATLKAENHDVAGWMKQHFILSSAADALPSPTLSYNTDVYDAVSPDT